MSHGLGVTEFVAGNAPVWLVMVFVLITQLGDLWFYFLAISTVYFYAETTPRLTGLLDRRRGAYLLALALGAISLTVGLKHTVAHPRPPGAEVAESADLVPALVRPVYVSLATGSGYTFPSGHATGAAIVWGGVGSVLPVRGRRHYLAFGSVVGLVALSRVVIGVHYLLDVVAGLLLGFAYLFVVDRLSARGTQPSQAMSVAALVATVGVLLAGVNWETVAALGATLGTRLAWELAGDRLLALPASRAVGLASLAVGLPVFGGVVAAVYRYEPVPAVSFVASALALAGLVLTPLAVSWVLEGRDASSAA